MVVDSLGHLEARREANDRLAANITKWFAEEEQLRTPAGANVPPTRLKRVMPRANPAQANTKDCGIFVIVAMVRCVYAYLGDFRHLAPPEVFKFDASDAQTVRKRLL